MKITPLFALTVLLLLSACTEKIDLAPAPENDSSVIIFYVRIPESPHYNSMRVFDDYDLFLMDTLPITISSEIPYFYRNYTVHELHYPRITGKELWIRVHSDFHNYIYSKKFVYQSPVFIPYSDSLIIDSSYENWIQE